MPVLVARESFALAAASGRLRLPRCTGCGAFQYPPKDTCSACLSPDVQPTEVDGGGRVVATTVLRHTNDPRFTPLLPLCIASVRLDAGPLVIACLRGDATAARVHVTLARDELGQAVLLASAAAPGDRHE